MTVLRCTAKLLKRLKQPGKPREATLALATKGSGRFLHGQAILVKVGEGMPATILYNQLVVLDLQNVAQQRELFCHTVNQSVTFAPKRMFKG
jgi:hypothetical protein